MKIWPDPLNLDQLNPPLLNRLNANVLQRLYCTIEQNIIVLYGFSIYRQVLPFFLCGTLFRRIRIIGIYPPNKS
jgi:hypothetical protein